MSGVATPLSTRGVQTCRACQAERLESILDLGDQPLANELLLSADAESSRFPLHLRICTVCGLGQVGEFVLPERIFTDYSYLSSVSSSWVEHCRKYAQSMRAELGLVAADLVVEVASNDGYLLGHFRDLGMQTVGIEPAENVAALARAEGIETVSAFFGRTTAEQIVEAYGHPRLVVANNVMAHVPELNDFVAGLECLCDRNTVITVENPSFVTLLNETQFDTIYHEHFSYLSAHVVRLLVARHGMDLVRVEQLPTHGGSYRYWIVPQGRRPIEQSVATAVERELRNGLLSREAWDGLAHRTQFTVEGLRSWLEERSSDGTPVAAYGAAAKGNTLLNAAAVSASQISVVADGSREKQGKFLPGSRIPIVAPPRLADADPVDVLILPWNIAPEIAPLVRRITPRARSWTAVPSMMEMDG